MEKRFDPNTKGKENKQARRKKWYKAVCSLAAAVVVCTVYTLMLPALTLDEESAGDAGISISESSVPTSDAPASTESASTEAAGPADSSESHTDAAADSSADSSQENAPSGPAADAPSNDSAANAPADQPSTLPAADDQSNGVVIDEGQSSDEAPAPDADTNNENNSSNEDSNNEENSSSSSSSDADNEDISDPTADVEDASIWESTIPDLSDCSTWAEKLLLVASSQIGYQESAANFEVLNGEHKGYTRYGEWYGNPYGDWCAMFVSFCLNYAGIDTDIIPQNANCQTWVEQLKDNEIFEDPDTYLPEPGDIVFFDQSGSGHADHVGIVSDVEYGTKKVTRHVVVGTETAVEDSPIVLLSYANSVLSADIPVETLEAEETETTVAKSIEVIEGNSSDQVQPVTYDMTDSSILGLASLYEAEYIHNGGDIDDIKNTDKINQPVTLENKDILAVQTQESYTIKTGETKTIFSYSPYSDWISSNSDVANVSCEDTYYSGYYRVNVEGKSEGTATITSESAKISYSVKVELIESNLYIYTLIPGEDPNDTSDKADIRWNGMGVVKIKLPYAPSEQQTGYKIYSNEAQIKEAIKNGTFAEPESYPDITYPDGGKTYKYAVKGSENSYKEGFYTIDWFRLWVSGGANAGHNGFNSPTQEWNVKTFHLDGTLNLNEKDRYQVNFMLKDAGETEFNPVDPEKYTYRVDSGTILTPEDKYIPTAMEPDTYLSEKELSNGIKYKFDGWYLEESCTNKVDFSKYPITKDTTFYAKYVDCTVNYKVAPKCEGSGTVSNAFDNLSEAEDPTGSVATPNDGYTFEGWYTDENCTSKVPDEWVSGGQITPQRNADDTWSGVAGKTYYAKFTTGVELPETGGPGTTLLYLLGALLTTATLTITFIRRRKSTSEEN